MAHTRELVGVLPLFAMRLSLAHGPVPRAKDRELTCAADTVATRETKRVRRCPTSAQGGARWSLRDIHVLRCHGCANVTIEVPEPSQLDTLIRCLVAEIDGPLPQPAYEMGHWCILPRRSMAS
jgi:hypothetical protein